MRQSHGGFVFPFKVPHESEEIYILQYLRSNNSAVFSFSNVTLSAFSVRVIFHPQHGQILDEILDELLTRKYKLILVTLRNSLPGPFFWLSIFKSPDTTPTSAG